MRVVVWFALLAAVNASGSNSSTSTTAAASSTAVAGGSATGSGVCTGSNDATCCKPDGVKFCARIRPQDIWKPASANGTDVGSVCVWSNLAGQTPDANPAYNAPYLNNFACGGTKGDCNYKSTAYISDTTGEPYYAAVANLSEIDAGAKQAATYYKAFNVALSRYNCEEQYSHWNCDDCRKAYARWACAMTMPKCTASPCGTTKPCVRVCNEVVQKCPVTLGFTCPDDNRDYSASSCNLMGLTNGASNTHVPSLF